MLAPSSVLIVPAVLSCLRDMDCFVLLNTPMFENVRHVLYQYEHPCVIYIYGHGGTVVRNNRGSPPRPRIAG